MLTSLTAAVEASTKNEEYPPPSAAAFAVARRVGQVREMGGGGSRAALSSLAIIPDTAASLASQTGTTCQRGELAQQEKHARWMWNSFKLHHTKELKPTAPSVPNSDLLYLDALDLYRFTSSGKKKKKPASSPYISRHFKSFLLIKKKSQWYVETKYRHAAPWVSLQGVSEVDIQVIAGLQTKGAHLTNPPVPSHSSFHLMCSPKFPARCSILSSGTDSQLLSFWPLP